MNKKELNIEIPLTTFKKPKITSPIQNPMISKVYPKCDYILNFDGCSKGNPGPAGIGAVIYNSGEEIWGSCQYIGKKTNNQSEYSALILGLKEALSRDIKQLQVYGDSLLVINQIKGIYKVNNKLLQDLYKEAMELVAKFEYIEFTHVYRKFNKRADQLSNLALDVLNES
jgi:ribonuclease HI